MSEKKDTTHILVPRKLVLFQRPRSQVWQCRFQMDGKWQRASTNITEKPRVLYSLRHTYATIALQHDKIPLAALTRQMGTSVKMMEQHYSHLDAKRFSD